MIAVLGEEDIPAVQAQLARRLGKTSAAVSEVIIRLEADGYITRSGRVDQSDRGGPCGGIGRHQATSPR